MIIRQSGAVFLEQLLLGTDTGGMSEMLILLSYSRQFEREADEGAIELLSKAEIDTAPFGAFFTRMSAERHGHAMPAILVTHRRLTSAAPWCWPAPSLRPAPRYSRRIGGHCAESATKISIFAGSAANLVNELVIAPGITLD